MITDDGRATALVERQGEAGAAATFSPCGLYRYQLTRRWLDAGPLVTFLMLNPSTATEAVLDPTVTRCVGFARREGAGALQVLNLFALRSTDPRALYDHADPVGPINDEVIVQGARASSLVVAGWGIHGALQGRGTAVRALLAEHGVPLHHLGLTKAGHPKHPLYLRGDTPLTRWDAPEAAR